MQVNVNGVAREVADGIMLVELVAQASDRTTGIAVALNHEVVPRSSWAYTSISAGDVVDVVTAVQGG